MQQLGVSRSARSAGVDNQRAHEPDRVDCTHWRKAPRTAATVSLLLFQGFISVKVAQMCHPGIGSIRHSVPRASLLNPSQASPVLESFIDASYGVMVWALLGYISFRVPYFLKLLDPNLAQKIKVATYHRKQPRNCGIPPMLAALDPVTETLEL